MPIFRSSFPTLLRIAHRYPSPCRDTLFIPVRSYRCPSHPTWALTPAPGWPLFRCSPHTSWPPWLHTPIIDTYLAWLHAMVFVLICAGRGGQKMGRWRKKWQTITSFFSSFLIESFFWDSLPFLFLARSISVIVSVKFICAQRVKAACSTHFF